MLRLAAAAFLIISPAYGQTVDDLIAEGDSLWEALQPAAAIVPYAAAIQRDQGRAEAWWKYARSQVDVAKQLVDDDDREARDSIYGIARAYAQSALNIDAGDADAHFVLALVLGEQSRTRGGRERIQFAAEIYDEATTALSVNPEHDGAMHILGAWHAEVRRLSGLTRFFAKTLFGGGFLDRANWDSATTYLERAVAIKPSYIFHRLELARIYVDTDRPDDALRQLEAIVPLAPTGDVLDPRHKAEAAKLESELRSR